MERKVSRRGSGEYFSDYGSLLVEIPRRGHKSRIAGKKSSPSVMRVRSQRSEVNPSNAWCNQLSQGDSVSEESEDEVPISEVIDVEACRRARSQLRDDNSTVAWYDQLSKSVSESDKTEVEEGNGEGMNGDSEDEEETKDNMEDVGHIQSRDVDCDKIDVCPECSLSFQSFTIEGLPLKERRRRMSKWIRHFKVSHDNNLSKWNANWVGWLRDLGYVKCDICKISWHPRSTSHCTRPSCIVARSTLYSGISTVVDGKSLDDLVALSGTPVQGLRMLHSSLVTDLTKCFTDVFKKATSVTGRSGDIRSLIMFKFVLSKSLSSGTSKKRAGAFKRAVKARLTLFKEGAFDKLLLDHRDLEKAKGRKAIEKDVLRGKEAIRSLIAEGRSGKALQWLKSGKVAEYSSEVVNQLEAKHPNEDPPNVEGVEKISQFDPVTPSEVLRAIKSFDRLSTAGPLGLAPATLLDMVECGDAGNRLLEVFADFYTSWLSGSETDFPSSLRSIFFGARLVALEKGKGTTSSSGNVDVRPIAVGTTLRRVGSKILFQRENWEDLVEQHQLGVGVKGGAEIAVHGMRMLLQKICLHEDMKDYVSLSLDFKNAFNNVLRSVMLGLIKKHHPNIYPWVVLGYGEHSKLFYGSSVIMSRCGVQQGDPLGPALFSVVVAEFNRKICEKFPGLNNVWYLDDGSYVGPKQKVFELLKWIFNNSRSYGLILNQKKTTLINPMGLLAGKPNCPPQAVDVGDFDVSFSMEGDDMPVNIPISKEHSLYIYYVLRYYYNLKYY